MESQSELPVLGITIFLRDQGIQTFFIIISFLKLMLNVLLFYALVAIAATTYQVNTNDIF